MVIREAMRQQLISRDTALSICRLVLADVLGAEALRRQEPLSITDGDDVWNLKGAIEQGPQWRSGVPRPIQMAISKFDGAIISFFGPLPKLAQGADQPQSSSTQR
jgi:hypothetical protein